MKRGKFIMEKMIAKAIKGKEFLYSRNSAHSVSAAGAKAICDALNSARYQLKENEIWHVFDCGWYEKEYTAAGYQKFARRQGRIYEGRI